MNTFERFCSFQFDNQTDLGQYAVRVESFIEIAFGQSKAKIGLKGAALIGLTLHGKEVIPEAENPVSTFAGSLLAPWPNRISGGAYSVAGVSYSLPDSDGHGNALHGLVFDQTAKIERLSDSQVTLVNEIKPVDGYPFEMEVLSTFELFEKEIRIEYALRNLSHSEAPAGIGAHPYFPFDKTTKIEVLAQRYSVHGENKIPIEERNTSDLQLGPGNQRLVHELELDTQFSEFGAESNGVLARLQYQTFTLEITQDPPGWVMIYTARDYPWHQVGGGAIAIEPQTCAVDAFNNGKGLTVLKSGKTLRLKWGIRLSEV